MLQTWTDFDSKIVFNFDGYEFDRQAFYHEKRAFKDRDPVSVVCISFS